MNAELQTKISIIERRLAHARVKEHKAHLSKLDWVIQHAESTRERMQLEEELAELELQRHKESHL